MTAVSQSASSTESDQSRQRSGSRGLAYQPALDGLRAFAVIVIMLYHGGQQWIPGGFLSVDVFFGLSGYLITSLLLAEWERHGRLDLKQFWIRRGRRLLPALFVMLTAVAVMGVVIGGEFARTVRSDGLASLFYVSNWWFISQDTSYTADLANQRALTHTWTLAIEEQWYLFLPLFLILLLPLLPKLRTRRILALTLVALAIVSALWMAYLAPTDGSDPSRVYFGTDTRVQSLLLGSALACVAPYLAKRRILTVAALGTVVLVFIAMATVHFQNPTVYRGGFLLMSAGVVAVIADVTAHPQGLLAKGLSWGPLVAIGKASYGLYLWHWPVYVLLSPERTGLDGAPLLAIRVALTGALAALSYHFIETPIRRNGLQGLKPGARWAVIIGAPVVVVGALVAAPVLAAPPPRDSLVTLADNLESMRTRPVPPERLQAPRVVLLGDSQTLPLWDLYPSEMTAVNPIPALQYGCGVVPYEAAIDGKRMTLPAECGPWGAGNWRAAVTQADAEVAVLMAGSWEQYDRWTPSGTIGFRDPRWQEQLEQAYAERLQELHRSTGRVALLLNHCHGAPMTDRSVQEMYSAGRYPPVVNDPARVAAVNRAAVAAAKAQDFPVRILDINPVLCPDGFTESIDGQPLRTDGLHLSEAGARLAWEYLEPELARLAEQSPSNTDPAPAVGPSDPVQ